MLSFICFCAKAVCCVGLSKSPGSSPVVSTLEVLCLGSLHSLSITEELFPALLCVIVSIFRPKVFVFKYGNF